jgi:hypothetical protein
MFAFYKNEREPARSRYLYRHARLAAEKERLDLLKNRVEDRL